VSNYPASPADVNLRAMTAMAEAFHVPVGYSDHVLGNEVSLAAAALGASIIEKHFTLDRALPGPEQRAALEPAGLTALVEGIRAVESALGGGCRR
jgi:sialic acid synthase SpsE